MHGNGDENDDMIEIFTNSIYGTCGENKSSAQRFLLEKTCEFLGFISM